MSILIGQHPREESFTVGIKNTSCMLGVTTFCVFQPHLRRSLLSPFIVEELAEGWPPAMDRAHVVGIKNPHKATVAMRGRCGYR